MHRKKIKPKAPIEIRSLNKYTHYLENITQLSFSSHSGSLVVNSRGMINLDKVVDALKIDVKSTDAIHYNLLENKLYLVEFKNGSILEKEDEKEFSCHLEAPSCKVKKNARKLKNEEIKANLALKGVDTFLIVLKNILNVEEYKMICEKKIKLNYVIVNTKPKETTIGNLRKQNRLETLSNLNSIGELIPSIFKRYEGVIFDKVIFTDEVYFEQCLLDMILG